LPQGISNDPKGPAGTYYAAVGQSFLRLAHVSLPLPAGGLVTGNGCVDLTDPITGAAAGTGYFTLEASKSSPTAAPRGSVTVHYPDGNVISLSLTRLTFSGNGATIEGLCKSGSNCTTFIVTVQDNGWSNDALQITRNPVIGIGIARNGAVRRGNIKVYRYE
jgi:hypothetical protein